MLTQGRLQKHKIHTEIFGVTDCRLGQFHVNYNVSHTHSVVFLITHSLTYPTWCLDLRLNMDLSVSNVFKNHGPDHGLGSPITWTPNFVLEIIKKYQQFSIIHNKRLIQHASEHTTYKYKHVNVSQGVVIKTLPS